MCISLMQMRRAGVDEASCLCVLGTDQDDGNGPPLHLFRHLAPGTGCAEGGVQTVVTHGVFDAVAFPH